MPASMRKSLDDLRAQAKKQLEASGKVTNLEEGGVARSLLDIAALQISEAWDALDFQTAMARLSTAAGVFLDLIGQSRGVSRGSAQTALVTREDEALKFYSVNGKTPLKTLLSGGKVASGTLVKSTDGKVSYQVTADVFPDDVQTEVFVPAVSSSTGTSQNVGKGVLVTHNLGTGDVAVVNTEAIASAQDTESDANYRYRISRALAQASGATEDAIRLAAFSFPGVASVTLRPFSDGVGTIEVLCVPVGNRFPADTLRGIEAAVKRAAPAGTRVRVKAPEELPVQLTIQLEFRREVRAADRSRVREQARQAILLYLGEIRVGGQFVLNELTQRVMDVSDEILDHKVLLFRFRKENLVLRNVQAEADEMFSPFAGVENPIQVI